MPLHTCSTMVHIYDYQLSSLLSIITILILKSRCTAELSVTWDLIFCLNAGALEPQKQHTCFPDLSFHSQVIAQFWGHIWGVKPSPRVPCPPCWPAFWCTAPSHVSATLTSSWRVGRSFKLIKFFHKSSGKETLAVLCQTTHLILLLPSQIYLMTPLNCLTVGKPFSILSSYNCVICVY